jgi:hypothetical protein
VICLDRFVAAQLNDSLRVEMYTTFYILPQSVHKLLLAYGIKVKKMTSSFAHCAGESHEIL